MRSFVAAFVLAASVAARADDPAVAAEFQGIYSRLDQAGWTRANILAQTNGALKVTDCDKRPIALAEAIKAGATSKVESADTLAGVAKAHVRLIYREGNKEVVETELHTWMADGDTWKLSEIKITSKTVLVGSKTVLSESERVPTDYEKSYGHYRQGPSAPRRHGRSGRLTARAERAREGQGSAG